jgi:hypothetical protein
VDDPEAGRVGGRCRTHLRSRVVLRRVQGRAGESLVGGWDLGDCLGGDRGWRVEELVVVVGGVAQWHGKS